MDAGASKDRIREEDPGPAKEGEDGARGGKEELEEELEKEAIAGRDEGRAPTDYDRRGPTSSRRASGSSGRSRTATAKPPPMIARITVPNMIV